MNKLIKIKLRKFILSNSRMGNENIRFTNFHNKDFGPTTDPDKVHKIFLKDLNYKEIPEEIFYFPNLKRLYLYPPIKNLDERLAEISPLKKLNINSSCGINKNDPVIQKLRNKGVEVIIL